MQAKANFKKCMGKRYIYIYYGYLWIFMDIFSHLAGVVHPTRRCEELGSDVRQSLPNRHYPSRAAMSGNDGGF